MFGNSDLKKTDLYAILVGIFCASLIVSNIIASKSSPPVLFRLTLPSPFNHAPAFYLESIQAL